MREIQNILEAEKNLNGVEGVIFDMDDTLYSEKDYVRSGYAQIAKYLNQPEAAEKLWYYFEQKQPAIDMYLAETGRMNLKNECLKIYRHQMPEIQLYKGVAQMLVRLSEQSKKLGIITDGRVEGQENKIAALGLKKLVDDIIITDALGGIEFRKPNEAAFRLMQEKWQLPFKKMIYIGDNPQKDFIAPEKLGMQSMYFCNPDGLYSNK